VRAGFRTPGALQPGCGLCNAALPAIGEPRGLIGPLWDDLTLATPGRVYYQSMGEPGGHTFVIQWNRAQFTGTTGSDLTFQVRLTEGVDTIEFAYGGLLGYGLSRERVSGSSTGVAVQSYDRDRGLTVGNDDEGLMLSGSWYSFYYR
jgi:hypothetical protein